MIGYQNPLLGDFCSLAQISVLLVRTLQAQLLFFCSFCPWGRAESSDYTIKASPLESRWLTEAFENNTNDGKQNCCS